MRRLVLTAVLAGLAISVPAHASSTADEADAMGVLTCTLTFANSVGTRPFPTTPYGAVSYGTATAFSGVNYAICVAI